jgi:hypothetical protein
MAVAARPVRTAVTVGRSDSPGWLAPSPVAAAPLGAAVATGTVWVTVTVGVGISEGVAGWMGAALAVAAVTVRFVVADWPSHCTVTG